MARIIGKYDYEEWSDMKRLLALKNGERVPWAKEWKQPLEARKDKEMDSPLGLLEQNAAAPTPLCLLRPTSNTWPTEL